MSEESSAPSTLILTSSTNTVTTQNSLPPLITINAAAQLPIKLSPQNFPAWRAQFSSLLIGHKLSGYLDGTKPCPPQTIPKPDSNPSILVSNPAYDHWIQQDQLLLHGIIVSSMETVVPFIAVCSTSLAAWTKIQQMYANKSRSRIMSLNEKLTQPRTSSTSQEYFQHLRQIADELALINSLVHEDDLVIHALNEVGLDFQFISAAIRARESPISFEELLDKMIDKQFFVKCFA